jgi:hypothetical protein
MAAIRRSQARSKRYLVLLVCAVLLAFLLIGNVQMMAESSQNVRENVEQARQILELWESKGTPSVEKSAPCHCLALS